MPYLEQIVTEINKSLKESCFKESRFDGSRYENIATQAVVAGDGANEVILPLSYSNGEFAKLVFDDRYPISIYHRTLSNQYSFDNNNGYGRDKKKQLCNSTMLMCVMAFRDQIKISKEHLEAIVVSNFPLGNTPNVLIAPLQYCSISVIDSSLDSLQVYTSEFKGLEVKLPPENILFSIRYKIESAYFTGCFEPCKCSDS